MSRAISLGRNLDYIRMLEGKRKVDYTLPKECYWIWGESRSGKSKKAREICGDDFYYKL